jgi:hypothetical protein
MPNYRDLGLANSPTRLRGKYGRRLVGAAMFLLDSVAQGLTHAVRAPWLRGKTGGAYDAVQLLGSETSLPRYPIETWSQHRARIDRAWSDWPFAGDEDPLIAQLAAAGFPNAEIRFNDLAPGPLGQPAPYWSQFWVFFPMGSHPVTGPGPRWGQFQWGDGTLWGPSGITRVDLYTIRSIVRKWKPGDWVCRGLIFELSRPRWGEFTWGDGTVWSGAVTVGA